MDEASAEMMLSCQSIPEVLEHHPGLVMSTDAELLEYANLGPYEGQLVRELTDGVREQIVGTTCEILRTQIRAELDRAMAVFGIDNEKISKLRELIVSQHRYAARMAVHIAMGQLFSMIAKTDKRTNVLQFSAAILELLERYKSAAQVVALMDKNRMKDENEFYGYDVVNQSLWVSMRRLEDVLRDNDLIWRQGGDEFGLAAQVNSCQDARTVFIKVLGALESFKFTALVSAEQLGNMWHRYNGFVGKNVDAEGGIAGRIVNLIAPRFAEMNGLNLNVDSREEFLRVATGVLQRGRRHEDRNKYVINVETGWTVCATFFDPDNSEFRDGEYNPKDPRDIHHQIQVLLEGGISQLKHNRCLKGGVFHDGNEFQNVGSL